MAISSVSGNATTGTATDFSQLTDVKKRLEVSEKLNAGQSEIGVLNAAFSKLREALGKLGGMGTRYSRMVSDNPVVARSQILGLTYDAGAPENNDPDKHLADVAQFAGVRAGSFKINGVSIAVDPATDTLNNVLARIAASGAGVSPALDTVGDRVEIGSDTPRRPVVLDENGTGLFTALKIASRTYSPATTSTPAFNDPRRVRETLKDIGDSLAVIFDDKNFTKLDKDLLKNARDEIRTSLKSVVQRRTGKSGDSIVRTGLGIDFDFRDGQIPMSINPRQLEETMNKNFDKLSGLLFGTKGEKLTIGFAPTLGAKLEDVVGSLMGDLGAKLADGIMLDIKA